MTDRRLKGTCFAGILITMPIVLRYSSRICMHDVRLIVLAQTIDVTWHQGYNLVDMPAYVDTMKLGRDRAKAYVESVKWPRAGHLRCERKAILPGQISKLLLRRMWWDSSKRRFRKALVMQGSSPCTQPTTLDKLLRRDP